LTDARQCSRRLSRASASLPVGPKGRCDEVFKRNDCGVPRKQCRCYRILPRAATRQQPTTSSLRTRNASSCILTQVQTWLGTTVTTSPTWKRCDESVTSR